MSEEAKHVVRFDLRLGELPVGLRVTVIATDENTGRSFPMNSDFEYAKAADRPLMSVIREHISMQVGFWRHELKEAVEFTGLQVGDDIIITTKAKWKTV